MLSKLRLMVLAFMMVAMGAVANATVYNFVPSDPDLGDLDHYYSYQWGIRSDALYNQLNNGYVITAATLRIDNIYNWAREDNILYVALLNNTRNGLNTIWDNMAGGNQFASAVQIGTHTDPYGGQPNRAVDLVFNFNAALIQTLTSYILDGRGGSNNGHFGLGFDPDCHFYNDGACLTITTGLPQTPQDPVVPEPATLSMLGLGLAGAAAARRRKQRQAAA